MTLQCRYMNAGVQMRKCPVCGIRKGCADRSQRLVFNPCGHCYSRGSEVNAHKKPGIV